MASHLHRLVTLTFAATLWSCASREAIGSRAIATLGPGVVNNPANKSLRFDLLKFGLDRFCEQMLQGNAALKMSDQEPVLGRFFADSCHAQVVDDPLRKSFVVQYSGKGYAWTNLTGRIGFLARGLVEYAPDFQLHDGAMYVYFRPKLIDATGFQTLMVESLAARAGIALSGVNPDELGRKIVDSQLRRGFTVIRYSKAGELGFGLGIIPKGQRPFEPFRVTSEDKLMLANERTEIHSEQQDFLGTLLVQNGARHSLTLHVLLDGAAAVDLLLIPKALGTSLLDRYIRAPGVAPISAPPLFQASIRAGAIWKQAVPVPPGEYFVLLDHSSAIPPARPSVIPGDEHAARVDTLVLLGETP